VRPPSVYQKQPRAQLLRTVKLAREAMVWGALLKLVIVEKEEGDEAAETKSKTKQKLTKSR
jgi:hypothetical protein